MVVNTFLLLILLDYFIYFLLFIFLLRSIFILFMRPAAGGNGNDMFKFNPFFNPNINPNRNDFKDAVIAIVCVFGMTCVVGIVGIAVHYLTNRNYVLSPQVESNTVLCNILIELLLIEKDFYNFSSDADLKPQVVSLFSQLDALTLNLNFKDLIYIFHEVQTRLDYIAKITPGAPMDSSSFSLDTKKLYYQVHFKTGISQFVPKTGTISLEEQEHYLNLLNQALKGLKIRYKLPI